MKSEPIKIEGIPAILWGKPSDRLYLAVHGQGGQKEEAAAFSAIAGASGWQVLSMDLPEHGQRKREGGFDPWHVVPELQTIYAYARARWSRIALRGESIGAWFSLLGLADVPLERALLLSPVPDMGRLIETMMGWAGVTEARLKEEGQIPTDFGQTLSWEYLTYVRQHPVERWDVPTAILYAGQDHLVPRGVIDGFAARFGAKLTVMETGEHWFHTPEQLDVLQTWTKDNI